MTGDFVTYRRPAGVTREQWSQIAQETESLLEHQVQRARAGLPLANIGELLEEQQ